VSDRISLILIGVAILFMIFLVTRLVQGYAMAVGAIPFDPRWPL
jgi:hypothetical protein